MRILAVILAVVCLAGPAWAADYAATITMVKGQVLRHQDGQTAPTELKLGDSLLAGDEVETTKDAAAIITFTDGSTVTMGAAGAFSIDDYVLADGKVTKNHFSVLRTAFEYWGKTDSASDVRVNIDLGSIGIRGTHFVRGMRDGTCWIYLQDGAITVSNEGGTVNLAPGQGTAMSARDKAPTAPEAWSAAYVDWIIAELPQSRIEGGALPTVRGRQPLAGAIPSSEAPPAVVTPEPAPPITPPAIP
ncbi:MAG: FecR domain-containing protein [Alphaproteobacteria bacterium]|nr:FecR domain-containing protein [Alphaproteobacteria bacterium]MBU0859902.1 FecR domain-containing protein [Alphaproteobacteria bacterium]